MSALTLRREKLKLERTLLLERGVDERVGGGVEHPRLAEGADHAVFGDVGRRSVLRVEG